LRLLPPDPCGRGGLDSEVSLSKSATRDSWSCGWNDLRPAADMSSVRPTSGVDPLPRSTDEKCPHIRTDRTVSRAIDGDHEPPGNNRPVPRPTVHICRLRDALPSSPIHIGRELGLRPNPEPLTSSYGPSHTPEPRSAAERGQGYSFPRSCRETRKRQGGGRWRGIAHGAAWHQRNACRSCRADYTAFARHFQGAHFASTSAGCTRLSRGNTWKIARCVRRGIPELRHILR
jgi:hypothetical protein